MEFVINSKSLLRPESKFHLHPHTRQPNKKKMNSPVKHTEKEKSEFIFLVGGESQEHWFISYFLPSLPRAARSQSPGLKIQKII
jgi:hypothetical protein